MQVYLSHLPYDDVYKRILDEYPTVGIESIEFSMSQSLENLQESLKMYKERMGDYIKNRPLSLHGPFLDLNPMSFDSDIAKITWERYSQAYEAAVELNADRVVYHTCFLKYVSIEEGWAERVVDFYDRFMEDKDAGIQIHIENVGDPHWRMIRKVIDEVNHPSLSACLDIGHAHAYTDYSTEDWMEGLDGHIGHFHIHDNFGSCDSHMALGTGDIAYPWVMQQFKEAYADGCCTIENSSREDCMISLAYLKTYGII